MIFNGTKVNEIYQTNDLSKFKFRKDNRIINHKHVNSLVKSMSTNGWLKGSYVVINENGEIIDGQHRVLAAINVGVPVNYTMEINTGLTDICNLNKNQKNWLMNDHVNGFINEGNQNYIQLDKFMRDFPELKITECIMLLTNGATSVIKRKFENGEFTVKDIDVAYDWGHKIMSMKKHIPFYNKNCWVRALLIMFTHPKFVFEEFVHKFELRPTLRNLGNRELFIEEIEKIYNFSRNNKVTLRYKPKMKKYIDAI